MVDPLSIYGAASTVVETTIKIIRYIREFRHAKEEHSDWIRDIESIKKKQEKLIARLQNVDLNKNAPWYRNFIEAMGLEDQDLKNGTPLGDLPFQSNSPFGRFKQKLEKLNEKLYIKPGKLHEIMFQSLHYFNKAGTASMFGELDKVHETFAQTIQLDHFILSEAIYEEVVGLSDDQFRRDKLDALNKLSRLDFAERQNQVYATCFRDGQSPPSEWFLTSQEFIAWRAGRPWPLYCVGKPGAGKVMDSVRHRILDGC